MGAMRGASLNFTPPVLLEGRTDISCSAVTYECTAHGASHGLLRGLYALNVAW